MPEPPTSSDSIDITRRFKRLQDSVETKEPNLRAPGEPSSNDQFSEQKDSALEEISANIQVDGESISPESVNEILPYDTHTQLAIDDVEKTANDDVTHLISLPQTAKPSDKIIPPEIDEYGMPIPNRINRITQASTHEISNFNVKTSSTPISSPRTPEVRPTHPINHGMTSKGGVKHEKKKKRHSKLNFKLGMGCAIRMLLLGSLAGIVLLLLGGSFIVYEYYKIAATLPSVADLQQRASTFETTRMYDRNGGLLYEILDPNAGRRTFTTLDKISPILVAATIATEDKSFYSHPGFDWTAIVRAFWQNFRGGGTVSGASTITQQLARSLLLSPEERNEQSYIRKVREALLAAEITRRYSKDEILELYLNEFYYGNLAYGVEAAAETYFHTHASELDLAQASFLAGLPQAPSIYDVYNNREATRDRQKQVLTLMYEASNEQGCIFVSNSLQRVCVDAQSAIDAYTALDNYQFNPPEVQMRYPHWVNYVRSILESQFDAQTIYHSGFSIYTTIDPDLQDQAETLVRQQIDALVDYNATNGALVAIEPSTGEVLAMVGSADFYNEEIDGQVNMATSPTRQPGSSIKPITYLAAFEKGWTPASLIWDVPSEFPPSGDPNDPRPPYAPVNYDGRFHGPNTLRSALANSYNIPAVKALQFVGIYDNPETPNVDGMLATARKLGITSLIRPDYGLSLTLGGGEVSLFEMTAAYSVIANAGSRVPPVVISKILDHNGNVVYEYQLEPGEQVIRSEHAFLISSILSDNESRSPMFGQNSVLNLPFPAAAKTGTSNDYRDNWTLGYTPDIAVGVWVGNADYSPMKDISGVTGAAPIWSDFMSYAHQKLSGGNPTPFFKPSGIVDRVICTISGTEPSQWCTNQRSEYFAADQLPLPSTQDLWTKVVFDTWTGLRVSAACPDYSEEEFALNVTDPWAIGWIQNSPEGKAWAEELGFETPIRFAPPRDCEQGDSHPIIEISSPIQGQIITASPLEINGKIDATGDFQNFIIEYGTGDDPPEWQDLLIGNQPISQPGKIYEWDVKTISLGGVTLKITIHNIRGGYAEREIKLNMQVATPTPTITLTPFPSATPTPTLTPTPTFFPTATPVTTQNPTATTPPGSSRP